MMFGIVFWAVRDRVILVRIRKMIPALREKPALLQTLMNDLEQLHPWSQALANAVAAASDELLESSG